MSSGSNLAQQYITANDMPYTPPFSADNRKPTPPSSPQGCIAEIKQASTKRKAGISASETSEAKRSSRFKGATRTVTPVTNEAVIAANQAIFAAGGPGTPAEAIYRPLQDSLQSTRLLTLSEAKDGRISCDLEEVSLSHLSHYTALSYCWGNSDDTRTVFVNDISVRVTKNLYDALERLHAMKVSRLWVDALCINQSDNRERGHQVRLMKSIYSKAQGVIGWIGKSSEDSSQAMVALKRMPSATSHARDTIWKKLESLFARPYWKRIWIIQELAVANEVRIVCGRDSVMWDDLEGANEAYEHRPKQITLDKTNYSYIKNISHFRKKCAKNAPISLLEALFTSQEALSSVPYDKIFGLLGLCEDGGVLVPAPNYERPIGELLQDLTRRFICLYRSLEFAFAAEPNSTTNSTLPSWCPDWLSPWAPSTVRLLGQLDLQCDPHQSLSSFKSTESSHKILGVIGRKVAGLRPDPSYIDPKLDFNLAQLRILEMRNAACGFLFHDSFFSFKATSREPNSIEPYSAFKNPASTWPGFLSMKFQSMHSTELESTWFKTARKVLKDLCTQGNKRSELREAIHALHLEEHPTCSMERKNKWQAEEESWSRHLCFEPNHALDYELKAFNEVMTWLDEFLNTRVFVVSSSDSGPDDSWPTTHWPHRLPATPEDADRDLDLPDLRREMVRSVILASRERRYLLQTTTGQLAISNARPHWADEIFQVQGSNELVILRRSSADHKKFYQIVSRVYIGQSGSPILLPSPKYINPKFEVLEIC
jgi:Heterokaryon incompatibility protein (HET)